MADLGFSGAGYDKDQTKVEALQKQVLYHRARCNRAARLGHYRTEMEKNMDSRAS
jgi:hypothetical protein